jgi:signal transduction histidine kinase
MNLKFRFALLFTFFVSVVLAISSVSIYFLYESYRESQFLERVKTEGRQFHNISSFLAKPDKQPSDLLYNILHYSTVYDERIIILDSSGALISKAPDTMHFSLSPALFTKIKEQKEYAWFSENKYQYVGIVLDEDKKILVAAGFDKTGFEKSAKLRLILFFVFVGAMLVTAFIAFFFVRQAFLPLTRLSMQMNRTTFQNLTHRIPINEEENEINDIARNFNSMLERLGRAFEFQKSFVYHASHELRTPLATMLSQTELALGKQMTEADYRKVLQSLKEDQQEMIELTNSLLTISQVNDGEQIQNWPLLRIDEVLYEAISTSKKMFPDLIANMSFGTLPESDDDFVVRGNESLLKSVFTNLMKNAFLYSIDQKVDITLESDGTVIFVHFDNEGTQLPADEKENIMTPFFRGGNAAKTKGYGLGLAIVHRFITLHKGTITYTPISNDVNRFTVTLNKASQTQA